MRPLYALVATLGLVFLAAPVSALTSVSTGAASGCAGEVCDAINRVCQRVGGASCVGQAETAEIHCMGEACDAINLVCYKVFKVYCVG